MLFSGRSYGLVVILERYVYSVLHSCASEGFRRGSVVYEGSVGLPCVPALPYLVLYPVLSYP